MCTRFLFLDGWNHKHATLRYACSYQSQQSTVLLRFYNPWVLIQTCEQLCNQHLYACPCKTVNTEENQRPCEQDALQATVLARYEQRRIPRSWQGGAQNTQGRQTRQH